LSLLKALGVFLGRWQLHCIHLQAMKVVSL